MELPLVAGLAAGRGWSPDGSSALEAGLTVLFADIGKRFPSTPVLLLTRPGDGIEPAADRLAARLPAGRVQTAGADPDLRLIEDSHLLVLAAEDDTLSRLARWKLEGLTERRVTVGRLLDPGVTGPVVRIDSGTAAWHYPDAGDEKKKKPGASTETMWKRLDLFNEDARVLPASAASGSSLLPAGEIAGLSPGLRLLLVAHETADALAAREQRRTQRTLDGLLVLAFLSVLFLQIGPLANVSKGLSGSLYVLCLATAWAWFLWARHRQIQTKYLDYRALAEGLRVQFFWRFAGLSGSAADHYLRKQRSELDWIRHALSSLDLTTGGRDAGPPAADARRLGLVLSSWLEEQARYYAAAARKNDGRNRYINRLTGAVFAVGLALAFLKPFLDSSHPLVILIGLCPATAAFVKTWADKRAVAQLSRQYERMAVLFVAAAKSGREALAEGRTDEVLAVLREAGREALAENGDWVLLYRERQVRVPGA